jgi:hypothetical protein
MRRDAEPRGGRGVDVGAGSQIWTSRCYGCGCWVLILLDGPECAGLTQPCP